jgi:S-DNA-T family DNA segregation ATPase FtsK/SpoIIIE
MMDTIYLAAVHRRLLQISKPDIINNIFGLVANGSKQSTASSENSSFSVTKVRVAFECSRLFYLKQRFGGSTLFLPVNNSVGIGNAFHTLAKDFVSLVQQENRFRVLFEPDAAQLKLEEITSKMQQLFYELKFLPYLEASVNKDASQAPALHRLWQGLQGLIKQWAELLIVNRRYCSAQTVIPNTFVDEKYNLEHDFNLPNCTQQGIVGEFDCLIFNYELQRLCVVEYKTYQPVDPSAQLAQVALYSYMLWVKKKVPVDSAVYCVLPEFKEYKYSWEQLEDTVNQLIPYKLQQMQQWLTWEPPNPNPPPQTTQPYLCKICPQQQKCQSFFVINSNPSDVISRQLDKSEVVEPPTVPSTLIVKQPTPNSDATGEALVATLQSFKLKVDYLGAAIGPAFIRVKLKPHPGVSVNSILRLSKDLQVQMELANPPVINPQAGYVSIDLPRVDRQVASFEKYIQPQTLSPTAPVKIAIGVNLEGQLVEADLSDPNTCHFLVGGTTGSGKSEFLRSLLLSLLTRYSSSQLKIALVDPKRVTFPEFEEIRWLYLPVVKDSDRAIELMDRLVAEMEERYQMFEAAGCSDLSSYNQLASQLLPRIVCIFDEYADLMAEKDSRTTLEQSIKRLGAMARAAGIHLIIATQRPEAKVVTPLIRANLPGRVALRTASEADSKIILGGDRAAAAYLLGKGDLLYQVGAQLHRLQSLFATNIQLS